MKIIIQDVPKSQIPRNDVANYYVTPEALKIDVLSMSDWRYEALIALHEFIECMLVRQKNLDFKDIDDWDENNELMGEDLRAPYHKEHIFSENLERLFAQALNVDWKHYEDELSNAS